MKNSRSLSLLLAQVAVASCSKNPSFVTQTVGPHAAATDDLFWIFLGIESCIFILVLGFLFYVLWKRRTPVFEAPLKTEAKTEKKLLLGVSAAVGLTIVILTGFVISSYFVDRRLIELDRNADIQIEVTAHQWWWELRYEGQNPSDIFTTANEIHVPLHKKVRLVLRSSDVIHSIWFPNISGKKDIIPGRDQDLFIQVDKPGVWEGRCAEFCGMQHAFMGIKLFAESDESFKAWREGQMKPAAEPTNEEERHGQSVFRSASCSLCHAIRGSDFTGFSNNAPDLTHLKSRATIGAGATANSKGELGGWILDPHGIKPGVHMPNMLQEPADFQALLSYLEILK